MSCLVFDLNYPTILVIFELHIDIESAFDFFLCGQKRFQSQDTEKYVDNVVKIVLNYVLWIFTIQFSISLHLPLYNRLFPFIFTTKEEPGSKSSCFAIHSF